MARTAKDARRLVDRLSRPGEAQVLRGDLAATGLPGLVYTPASGRRRPAVAFGHGWMQPVRRYAHLLRHLASWGIVALAPDTQRGPFAPARALATDLRMTLDVATGARLGTGQVAVDPDRLAVAGHGAGGGAAILAAAQDERPRAVVLLAPAQVHPSAATAAESVRCPCLLLAAERDLVAPAIAHAEPIATSWAGPITARAIRKASHLGFVEGLHWTDALLDGRPEHNTHRLTYALVTAFLLKHLTSTSEYDALVEADLRAAPLLPVPEPVAGVR